MARQWKIAGLFAGIGGIEVGFERALAERVQTELLCEWWEPAQNVLRAHFPDVTIHPDIRELANLPSGLDLVSAGFPCTDLSQAGRTAGITGSQSSLVSHLFTALDQLRQQGQSLPWLMIENVPNMLSLDRGKAMHYLVDQLESLGYQWAYRVVDSRFTGVPQRRRRVILLASTTEDPRRVLFADDAGERPSDGLSTEAFGFYWTEGRSGLGWARDAVPTLKGGSTIGIPSPPAIWVPSAPIERRFVTPSIEEAEALQGFARGWTSPATDTPRKNGPRWKLVGNAVTTRVAEWVAGRLDEPGDVIADETPLKNGRAWPTAACGARGKISSVAISEFPRHLTWTGIADVVDLASASPLSHRAITGFQNRLLAGNLGRQDGFRQAVADYAQATAPPTLDLAATG